jgi:hypothetical protein
MTAAAAGGVASPKARDQCKRCSVFGQSPAFVRALCCMRGSRSSLSHIHMALNKDIGTEPEMVVDLTTEAESDTHTCVDVRSSNPRCHL